MRNINMKSFRQWLEAGMDPAMMKNPAIAATAGQAQAAMKQAILKGQNPVAAAQTAVANNAARIGMKDIGKVMPKDEDGEAVAPKMMKKK
jgi:hypothetical protein